MMSPVAGPRETPAALLFGAGKQAPQAAAERELGPQLRSNLGILERLPESLRSKAVAAIIAAMFVLLDYNVIELLVDGWREHRDLIDAARHTLANPGSMELVALATHSIIVIQKPSIDLLLDGERIATVELELTLQFDISAAVAQVSSGFLTALHSGRCDVTAMLAIQGAEAAQQQKRIELPGAIALAQGIRLLSEEDYLTASKDRTATMGKPATPVSSEPETVRMRHVTSNDKSATGQSS
jgi:hypothetical protein